MSKTPEIPKDFDAWRRLAASEPASFQAARRHCIEEAISRAPADRQDQLRRLQWRIDQTLRRAGSPLGGCIALSNMMWDSLAGPDGLLRALRFADREGRPRARVLPFEVRRDH